MMLGDVITKEKPRFSPLFYKLGVDFIMHNSTAFQYTNNLFFDGLYSTAHASAILFLVSNPESKYAIRQIAASAWHFNRFITNAAISTADYAGSCVISSVVPETVVFSKRNSALRAFKRMMLTLFRNGGIYREAFDIIANISSVFPECEKILKNRPFLPKTPHQYQIDKLEAIRLIQKDLSTSIYDVFMTFPQQPSSFTGPVAIYNAHLHNGHEVSIHVLIPHIQRMRTFDLFPFKLIHHVMSYIPFIRPERKLFGSFLKRLDYSLTSEYEARVALLEKYGVNMSGTSKEIFRQAKRVPLPFYIPAPVPYLHSENWMVTDHEFYLSTKNPSLTQMANIASGMSSLASKSMILPDIGTSNIRVNPSTSEVSFARFSSLKSFDTKEAKNLASLVFGYVSNSTSIATKSARALNLPRRTVESILNGEITEYQLIHSLLDDHSDIILSSCEASCFAQSQSKRIVRNGIRALAGFIPFSDWFR